ncbi:unnamed protein product [Lactuca virosa]|uniref:Large ribosomal subunit protein mL43 n=1 Tax=Lactuca virosa TaxID=75947 RepID=A0AAU9PQQ4_9ASTR|nr:unnamed protein product [Lactuca virosa]
MLSSYSIDIILMVFCFVSLKRKKRSVYCLEHFKVYLNTLTYNTRIPCISRVHFLVLPLQASGFKYEMSQRGVWQLQKLTVSYCNWGGSSRGIRAFMESHLQAFKENNPQLEVVTELNRGQHPFLKGSYKNKNERVVSVMNMTPEDVLLCATRLRNSLGRKIERAIEISTWVSTVYGKTKGERGIEQQKEIGRGGEKDCLNIVRFKLFDLRFPIYKFGFFFYMGISGKKDNLSDGSLCKGM